MEGQGVVGLRQGEAAVEQQVLGQAVAEGLQKRHDLRLLGLGLALEVVAEAELPKDPQGPQVRLAEQLGFPALV